MRVPITSADLAPNALRHWARETPDQILLEHVDGRRLTYRDVAARTDRWAAGFAATGLSKGTPVGYFVDDPLAGAVVWLSITAAGMIAVPLNTAHVGRMLRHSLTVSDVRVVIASPGLLERIDGVCSDTGVERVIVLGDGSPTTVDGVEAVAEMVFTVGDPPAEPFSPELHETAMFLLTSGTTGPSKAVVVPWAGAHSHWSWVPDDTLRTGQALYAPMQMFHNSGLGALQYVVWKGGRLVVRDKFSATAFWDDIRAHDVAVAGVVGPMTAVLWSAPPRGDDADNPLQSLVLGPMIESMEAFEERFGLRVCTCYGMTEVPAMIATGWDHGPWQTCGTVAEGWPWPDVEIVDEHDNAVADGQVGELVVRTRAPWALNAGYHNDPAATAAAWRNGWFHTGDAFRRDPAGHYYFVDRMKDAIRRRGENISSFEVESAVLEHAAVAECAAFAVPDGFGGDEVMIAIVPTDTDHPPAAADLFEFLAATMPAFMVPRYIDVVDEIPRNSTSLRVQKFVLRDRGLTPTTWDRLAMATDPSR